jgi:hypothetical protein
MSQPTQAEALIQLLATTFRLRAKGYSEVARIRQEEHLATVYANLAATEAGTAKIFQDLADKMKAEK